MINNTRVPRTEINGIYNGLIKMAMRKMLGGVPERRLPSPTRPLAP